jgi:hypothetical protein
MLIGPLRLSRYSNPILVLSVRGRGQHIERLRAGDLVNRLDLQVIL